AEHTENAEGAVDRLAEEILRRLEKGRTLVVWAFDASGSLQPERDRLAKHIETVYAHIAQLDRENKAEDGGLLTSVVAFGQTRKAMLDDPTHDPDAIAGAIRAIPLDTTGVETTFQTVAEIAQKWGRYKDREGRVYRAMIIVVTDEVGDDETYLDGAIEAANRAKAPVFVLGSQAIFGRTEGRVNFTDPKTGRTFYNVPVRQGPESVMLEQIRLPFWYGGNQFDQLESGFGPYALSRLAGATGGIYVVTRLGERRMGFDPAVMREYRPDWISRSRYEAEVSSRPIRKAVIEAALLTQQNLPGMPSLVFPPADGPEFKEVMERNQAIAAQTEYIVGAALEPINAVAKFRDREPSRRWQAHYDLIRGRLLAMKVRTDEFNFACADMKRNPRKFSKPEANAWRLVPDREVRFNDRASAAAEQAEKLLKRVIDEHPSTPWALLAERELKDPFGFKWVETRVQPIVRNNNADRSPARKKAQPNQGKPAEPPKRRSRALARAAPTRVSMQGSIVARLPVRLKS
ncbi:MAG: vWA domain-containing protein, partial [Isosphaeraceae bacterium]